ncbi:MAG: hypothetical protein C0602_01045 [Denitrovibrio sp.]|nr:MAG: hypothetical protein C0602_01045 [Denitrovibrio sp.]
MSAMAFVSITPLGEGESVSEYVSRAVKVIKDSGLEWTLTPMGTIVEGEKLEDVLTVITHAAEELDECDRLSISIKVDYRKNKPIGLETKVKSVMDKL